MYIHEVINSRRKIPNAVCGVYSSKDMEKINGAISPFHTVIDEEKFISEQLNLDVEKLEHYLNLFKQWINTQSHLQQDFSDCCLKKFLIWSKLDFEKAKKKFEKFCYNTVTHKEFTYDIFATQELGSAEFGFILPLSHLTPQGYKISCSFLEDGDKFDLAVSLRVAITGFDLRIHQDMVAAGDILILDMRNLKPRHYPKLFAPNLFKFITFAWYNYPFNPKHVIILNCHPLMEKGVNFCKMLLPKKISDRVWFASKIEELQKFIPRQSLPKDYGGTEKSLKELSEIYVKYLFENKEFYENLSKMKPSGPVPEEIRQFDNEFGVDGSFRRLNID